MSSHAKVSVLDVDNRHISFTHSARARILVKSGKAIIFNTNPFTIKLKGEQRVNEMKKGMAKRQIESIKNFTEYFKVEKDVYVQNRSRTQVSMQFGIMPNISSILIPMTRKPFNMSQHVPFKDLKDSVDLRKMCNRRPAVIVLMEEEEYEAYYEKLASENGTSADEEIIKAHEEQLNLMNRIKPVDTPAPKKKVQNDGNDDDDDNVMPATPRPEIVGLVVDSSEEAGDDRIKAPDLLERLKLMKEELTNADLDFLASNVTYMTVKKWVTKQLSQIE